MIKPGNISKIRCENFDVDYRTYQQDGKEKHTYAGLIEQPSIVDRMRLYFSMRRIKDAHGQSISIKRSEDAIGCMGKCIDFDFWKESGPKVCTVCDNVKHIEMKDGTVNSNCAGTVYVPKEAEDISS